MRYYKYLYLSDKIKQKRDKIIRRIEQNKLQHDIYLLLLPRSDRNQLEIIHTGYLLQPDYPKEDLFVVGIANSYDAALELVEKISQEVYDNTNEVNIRNYILRKEQEG